MTKVRPSSPGTPQAIAFLTYEIEDPPNCRMRIGECRRNFCVYRPVKLFARAMGMGRASLARGYGRRDETAAAGGALAANFRRQIAQQDRVPFGDHERSANNVLELAHIARPMILFQSFNDTSRRGFGIALLIFGELVQKIIDQQRNIFTPLAQWRNVNSHDIQPVKEVLAKVSC